MTEQTNLINAIGQILDILLPALTTAKEKIARIEAQLLTTQNTLNDAPQITEETVTRLVARMKDFIKGNNLPQVEKFISHYVKELSVSTEGIHLVLQYPIQLSLQDAKKLRVVVDNTRNELFQTYGNKNF